MADMAYNSLTKWKQDLLRSNVQPKALDSGGDFLSSETMVLIAGPARLNDKDGLTNTVPIGLVQNVQVNQNKQIQQIYEIGSRLPYMIPGRTVVSVGMSRVLFDGPSLMKALAFHKVTDSGQLSFDPDLLTKFKADEVSDVENPALPSPKSADDATQAGEFFINLASQFFNLPMGLGVILFDGEKDPYGGFYLNECYIQNHSFAAAAAQTVLIENISIRVTDLRPIGKDELP